MPRKKAQPKAPAKKISKAAMPAKKAPKAAKPAVKQTAKSADQNPLQTMVGKAEKAYGDLQKSRTGFWNDYKKGMSK